MRAWRPCQISLNLILRRYLRAVGDVSVTYYGDRLQTHLNIVSRTIRCNHSHGLKVCCYARFNLTYRLRVFENRVLRRIFGPKRDGVTGKWRKLHNEELNDVYSSPSIGDKIEKNEMGGACGTYGGRKRCTQGFGGET